MENRRLAFVRASAKLDTFLARAAEEFGDSARDRADTNRRIDAWVDAVEIRMCVAQRLDQLRQAQKETVQARMLGALSDDSFDEDFFEK